MDFIINFYGLFLIMVIASAIGSSISLLVFAWRMNKTFQSQVDTGFDRAIERQLKKEDEWVRRAGR